MHDDPVARLLRGKACFADDAELSDPLFVAFARSTEAAGRIEAVTTDHAMECAGVFAIHSTEDIELAGTLPVNPVLQLSRTPPFPIIAQGHVQAVGQPVAMVIADSRNAAIDGAEAIGIALVAEDMMLEPQEIASGNWHQGDVADCRAAAAHVVTTKVHHARLAPAPLEPRSISVAYDALTDTATIWTSTQTPHRARDSFATILGIDPERIRVIAQDVGGAFGMKASVYPEEVAVVWAAFRHRRSIKWTATRSEDFVAATQGRGITSSGTLTLDAAGKFTSLTAQIDAPLGQWLPNSALIPAWNAARILPSGYGIDAIDIRTSAATINLPPTGIYRGAGRPEAVALIERLVDLAAHVTGIDPIEIRKRNLVPQTAMPFTTATGQILCSGDYAAALTQLAKVSDYDALRTYQAQRRELGALVGIGISFYLEPSGSGWESATVSRDVDGKVTVASGSSAQGQQRHIAFGRIASAQLDQPLSSISVTMGDTATSPEGIGALASRSTAIGGSAVLAASRALKRRIDAGETGPISETVRYENDGQAWGYGAYLVMVSIDSETGTTTIEQATCVDDAGRLIAPEQVIGQIRGGFAQGWGEAMQEAMHHDADGQVLTGSFMDYALPRAYDLPDLHISSTQTPTPTNLLGAKGVGEAGTIGAPPAILNAVFDALAPLGVRELDMPLTPAKIWHAINAATKGSN
ncbi:xanthine dehydrogenase family protein molybdopterin-binding subunit [Sulfitobacter sp. S190]|uniref:xanthine dehydrogenase family protein molybdopterin-binding subunit n=1 Tax=Sulfitobacter sp. S190 TaxID=2867022 RepID=UPI0021A7D6B9|nr:xanthine dehydrogenase family protein molybdopterin-binding subunit [Sulfitobacter sp. S190]UWR23039.1 xanthine dehydrogenase family protein molybdopterin-binding subunit [Sulfitobacter sp. S190]